MLYEPDAEQLEIGEGEGFRDGIVPLEDRLQSLVGWGNARVPSQNDLCQIDGR